MKRQHAGNGLAQDVHNVARNDVVRFLFEPLPILESFGQLIDSMGFYCTEDSASELFFVLLEVYVDYFNLNTNPDIFFIAGCYLIEPADTDVLQLSDFIRKFMNRLILKENVTQIIDFKMSYNCLSILARVE